jgi:hypothetical protein
MEEQSSSGQRELLDFLSSLDLEVAFTSSLINSTIDSRAAIKITPIDCDPFLKDSSAVKMILDTVNEGLSKEKRLLLFTHNRQLIREIKVGANGRALKSSESAALKDMFSSLSSYACCRGFDEGCDDFVVDDDCFTEMYDGRLIRRSSRCHFVVETDQGEDDDAPSRCPACSRDPEYFEVEEQKRKRIRRKSPQKNRLKCTIANCKRELASKSLLRKHRMSEHGERKKGSAKECPICGKTSTTTSNNRQHLLTHDTVKQFSCDSCGKAFARADQLRVHAAVHTRDRDHLCTLCGKTFLRQSNLLEHRKRLHAEDAEDKALACQVCDKRFHSRQQVERHEAVHSGRKPFSCGDCAKSFSRRDKLKEHRKKLHAVEAELEKLLEIDSFDAEVGFVLPETIVFSLDEDVGDVILKPLIGAVF